jgi:class 3 adenylate cyclase
LIATWPLARGLRNATCVRACFATLARLVAHGADCEREFGTAAQVRASLHCGPVVVGEIGSVKKEIALSGDTLNTAARLVDVCRDSDESVIASAHLLDRLCFLLTLQRGHWTSSGYAARNRPSGFARWPRRCLIHASRRYEKMGTCARRLRP